MLKRNKQNSFMVMICCRDLKQQQQYAAVVETHVLDDSS